MPKRWSVLSDGLKSYCRVSHNVLQLHAASAKQLQRSYQRCHHHCMHMSEPFQVTFLTHQHAAGFRCNDAHMQICFQDTWRNTSEDAVRLLPAKP